MPFLPGATDGGSKGNKIMHTKTAFAAIAASIVLAACSTPYGSCGLLGGYTETQLADNVWQVTFEANGYTRQATTVRYAMLRCAELTLEQGYRYFVIVNKEAYSQGAGMISSGGFNATSSTMGNSTFTTGSTSGLSAMISYPTADQTIMMFKEKPEGVLSYDAETTCRSIGAKEGVVCSTLKEKGKQP